MLSPDEIRKINHEIALVPVRKAACIEALKIVQQHRGWISDDSLRAIAAYLEMSAEELDSVATFYNLIFRKPVGRNIILMCDSISCYVMGYREVYEKLQVLLNIRFGETTPDARFTLLPNACLGSCDHAPVLMINEDTYRGLTIEKLEEILQEYK
ncbi:NADH-quinone oxidoreductase subunit E [Pedobacter steynii]|uniref:NADH-quinone oxidoreductase subunit E n=1 Tax=Pedobacter steynii TaxID=430522 RepID=A0A1H0HPU5_9SPHI|nr:NADH-quinone oxidoreductase subunit NuoE [Pedobacter steynii]NQX42555.1 NADH-quinone oxidoreductase subunit NuoE [Pedobacter steynii]SDO20821.1 NADH-quinone oxidoreductase subunit E [Pedobacter steynii]